MGVDTHIRFGIWDFFLRALFSSLERFILLPLRYCMLKKNLTGLVFNMNLCLGAKETVVLDTFES